MDIGKLRHRLTLQSPIVSRADNGEATTSYSTDSTVWGSLRPKTGREIESSGQIQGVTDYESVIRYHSTISITWRIVDDDSDTYEVVSVLNYDERNEFMILELKKVT